MPKSAYKPRQKPDPELWSQIDRLAQPPKDSYFIGWVAHGRLTVEQQDGQWRLYWRDCGSTPTVFPTCSCFRLLASVNNFFRPADRESTARGGDDVCLCSMPLGDYIWRDSPSGGGFLFWRDPAGRNGSGFRDPRALRDAGPLPSELPRPELSLELRDCLDEIAARRPEPKPQTRRKTERKRPPLAPSEPKPRRDTLLDAAKRSGRLT